MRVRRVLPLVLGGLLASPAVPAGPQPVAVSPGDPSKMALIESRCPTFSWGAVAGVRSYDLMVYRLREGGDEADPVLTKSFAGSVSSWTPSLDSCLERGGRYAWSLRAISGEEDSRWSRLSLFQVATGPGQSEFEAALAVVERYLESRPHQGQLGSGSGSRPAARIPTPTGASTTHRSAPATGSSAFVAYGDPCCDGRLPDGYAVKLGNESTGNDPDVLALELPEHSFPTPGMNYIGFFDWDSVAGTKRLIGEIEGDGQGSIYFSGRAAKATLALRNWKKVVSQAFTCQEGSLCRESVSCGTQWRVLGGGYDNSPSRSGRHIHVLESYASNNEEWTVRIHYLENEDPADDGGHSWTITALCAEDW